MITLQNDSNDEKLNDTSESSSNRRNTYDNSIQKRDLFSNNSIDEKINDDEFDINDYSFLTSWYSDNDINSLIDIE